MDTSLTNKRQKMTVQVHGPPQPAFSLHFGHDASHSSSVIAADGQTICLRCATKVVAEAGSDGNAGAQAALQQLFAETMTILTKEPTHLDLHARECVELSSTTISALIAPESALAAVCNMRRCCLDLVLLIAHHSETMLEAVLSRALFELQARAHSQGAVASKGASLLVLVSSILKHMRQPGALSDGDAHHQPQQQKHRQNNRHNTLSHQQGVFLGQAFQMLIEEKHQDAAFKELDPEPLAARLFLLTELIHSLSLRVSQGECTPNCLDVTEAGSLQLANLLAATSSRLFSGAVGTVLLEHCFDLANAVVRELLPRQSQPSLLESEAASRCVAKLACGNLFSKRKYRGGCGQHEALQLIEDIVTTTTASSLQMKVWKLSLCQQNTVEMLLRMVQSICSELKITPSDERVAVDGLRVLSALIVCAQSDPETQQHLRRMKSGVSSSLWAIIKQVDGGARDLSQPLVAALFDATVACCEAGTPDEAALILSNLPGSIDTKYISMAAAAAVCIVQQDSNKHTAIVIDTALAVVSTWRTTMRSSGNATGSSSLMSLSLGSDKSSSQTVESMTLPMLELVRAAGKVANSADDATRLITAMDQIVLPILLTQTPQQVFHGLVAALRPLLTHLNLREDVRLRFQEKLVRGMSIQLSACYLHQQGSPEVELFVKTLVTNCNPEGSTCPQPQLSSASLQCRGWCRLFENCQLDHPQDVQDVWSVLSILSTTLHCSNHPDLSATLAAFPGLTQASFFVAVERFILNTVGYKPSSALLSSCCESLSFILCCCTDSKICDEATHLLFSQHASDFVPKHSRQLELLCSSSMSPKHERQALVSRSLAVGSALVQSAVEGKLELLQLVTALVKEASEPTVLLRLLSLCSCVCKTNAKSRELLSVLGLPTILTSMVESQFQPGGEVEGHAIQLLALLWSSSACTMRNADDSALQVSVLSERLYILQTIVNSYMSDHERELCMLHVSATFNLASVACRGCSSLGQKESLSMQLSVISTMAPLLADVGASLLLNAFRISDGNCAIGAALSFFCTTMQSLDATHVINAWLSVPATELHDGQTHTLSSLHAFVTVIMSLFIHSELTIQRLACASMASMLHSCVETGEHCNGVLRQELLDTGMQMTHKLLNNIIRSKSSSTSGGVSIADASCTVFQNLVRLEKAHTPGTCSMTDSNWCKGAVEAVVYSSTGTLCSSHLWFVATVLEKNRQRGGTWFLRPEAILQLLTDAAKAAAVGSLTRQSFTLLTAELQASALIPVQFDLSSVNHGPAVAAMNEVNDVAFDSSFRLVDDAILVLTQSLSTVFSIA